jgi:hypothetical protein
MCHYLHQEQGSRQADSQQNFLNRLVAARSLLPPRDLPVLDE